MGNNKVLLEIKKYDKGESRLLSDQIVRETSFDILVNDERLVSLSSLPDDLEDMALGFIFSEGLVTDLGSIKDTVFNYSERFIDFTLDIPEERIINFHATGEKSSGCGASLSSLLEEGKVISFPDLTLDAEINLEIMKGFIRNSKLFIETGGVHIAGLSKDNKILYFAEDIGRHNAVDKVAGKALRENEDLSRFILFCSGRISSEIVKKAVRLKIPLIISKSAPTSEAIRLGWDHKVYLIGFARNQRMNIYTGFTDLKIS